MAAGGRGEESTMGLNMKKTYVANGLIGMRHMGVVWCGRRIRWGSSHMGRVGGVRRGGKVCQGVS